MQNLTSDMETMRSQKDVEISKLTTLNEQQRQHYEAEKVKLEATLTSFQQITVKLESTVTELNGRLTVLEDVER